MAVPTPARADDTVDTGGKALDPQSINAGLFPDDECKQLQAAGYKCMGFKPAVRFSLPAVAFRVGSSELPDQLKTQLDAFALALKSRPPAGGKVRVEGHADASGEPSANLALSQKRADAAKEYLVEKGVNPELLTAVGVGAADPKDPGNPLAPENRRVVIGRDHAASAP
jgi:outer membrane protein OmpA-like peptidoglycan-associated protein